MPTLPNTKSTLSLGLLGWTDGCKIFKALETSYLVLFALILNNLLSAETLSQSTIYTYHGKKKPLNIIIQPQAEKKHVTQKYEAL